jgi:two-component system sensor histidine kinase RegB
MFWIYRPVPQLEMHHHGGGVNLHLIGMWISFAIAVLLVALYSARISELLREHEETLLRMQEELAKKDRFASLVTLSAGAAHELNTPLSTIAVVAKELERFATSTFPDEGLAEDSRLIRREVERCREILLRMSVDGAEPAGEAAAAVTVRELIEPLCTDFPPDRLRIELPQGSPLPVLTIPARAVRQAIAALVKNAIEASAPTSPIHVTAQATDQSVQVVVTDHGTGMPPDVLRRIGEPFFTTKEPGKGMGLGTFLARTVAERLGGRLTFQSSKEGGATAILELPVAVETLRHARNGIVVR